MSCNVERRIDWVGEPDHAQPQDSTQQPAQNVQTGRISNANDVQQVSISQNLIDGTDDDLQQRQQPQSIVPIFAKGTYLEFVRQ